MAAHRDGEEAAGDVPRRPIAAAVERNAVPAGGLASAGVEVLESDQQRMGLTLTGGGEVSGG